MDCDMLNSESKSYSDSGVNKVESNGHTRPGDIPVIFDKPTSMKRKCPPRQKQ